MHHACEVPGAPLRGIIPPLVTPLADRSTLDLPGLERLTEHVIGGGVHGMFILGTTGEAPGLGAALKHELVRRVCGSVARRVPVLVGISETAITESLAIAETAHRCGADALVLAPPYYFPATQAELLAYVERLAPQLPLPVFLYNQPYRPPVFAPETVWQAMTMPGIAGLKDSSGDMCYFQKIRALFAELPHASLFIGPEQLLAESVLTGAHGGVCAGANLFPKLYVALYHAAMAGELQRTVELHGKVMEVCRLIYEAGHGASSVIKGLKCALSSLGLCSDHMAEPFQRFSEPERSRIAEAAQRLKASLA